MTDMAISVWKTNDTNLNLIEWKFSYNKCILCMYACIQKEQIMHFKILCTRLAWCVVGKRLCLRLIRSRVTSRYAATRSARRPDVLAYIADRVATVATRLLTDGALGNILLTRVLIEMHFSRKILHEGTQEGLLHAN